MAVKPASPTDPLVAGQAALRDAAWPEARALFQEAVGSHGSPEAWRA